MAGEQNAIEKTHQDKFQIFEELDEQQIINADKEVKQALVYDLRGKKEITYAGIKHLALTMSNKDQSLQIEHSDVRLEKDDPDDKSLWFWRADIKMKNTCTGYETIGNSEAPYQTDKGTYDQFGRVKAMSKAERNAIRKQIPELEIKAMLTAISKEQVHTVDSPKTSGDQPNPNVIKTSGDHVTCVCPKGHARWDFDKKICNTCGLPIR